MPTPAALPRWLDLREQPAPAGDRTIDGRACRTRAGLFAELARALAFPPHFGRNWDACADCLRDAVQADPVLTVGHAEDLLAAEPHHLPVLLDIVSVLVRDTPAVTLALHPSPPYAEEFVERLRAATLE
ncbi:barstar family protein [Catellatospora tritici]|uniref:barstar family protein n=1 Tax=Catellatospora tritici TaxID=2851566 RepID=UPI001C2DE5E5|nr:barstar family protein [Catellatospora tritici]MBV1853839.1 barstar family protein [Catellatospora tritici]